MGRITIDSVVSLVKIPDSFSKAADCLLVQDEAAAKSSIHILLALPPATVRPFRNDVWRGGTCGVPDAHLGRLHGNLPLRKSREVD